MQQTATFLCISSRMVRNLFGSCISSTNSPGLWMSIGSLATRGSYAYAGIDEAVGDIDGDVGEDEKGRTEEDEGEHDIEVRRQHGLQGFTGNPGYPETQFDKERARGDPGEGEADDRDHGKERVASDVRDDNGL